MTSTDTLSAGPRDSPGAGDLALDDERVLECHRSAGTGGHLARAVRHGVTIAIRHEVLVVDRKQMHSFGCGATTWLRVTERPAGVAIDDPDLCAGGSRALAWRRVS